MQGLPQRLPLVLSKQNGVPGDALKEFKVDFDCYEACKEEAETCEAAAIFARMSLFNHSSVQLHVEA